MKRKIKKKFIVCMELFLMSFLSASINSSIVSAKSPDSNLKVIEAFNKNPDPIYEFHFYGNIKLNSSYIQRTDDIKYIVIHSTAVKNKTAEQFRYTYDNYIIDRKANAHYFVDDDSVIQMLDESIQAGHCYTPHPKIPCTNNNSIGIEICEFTDPILQQKAINNCVAFLKNEILVRYPDAIIVKHRDIKATACPSVLTDMDFQKYFGSFNE